MKKIINKSLIAGLIVGIIITSIVVHAYTVASSEVSFTSTKPGFTATNVESALNTLYDRSNNLYDRLDGTLSRKVYAGIAQTKTITQNLSKGHYYVVTTFGQSWNYEEVYTEHEVSIETYPNIVVSSSNATCERIQNNCVRASGEAAVIEPNKRNQVLVCDLIYKCSVPSSGTFSITRNLSETTNKNTNTLTINAIKID